MLASAERFAGSPGMPTLESYARYALTFGPSVGLLGLG